MGTLGTVSVQSLAGIFLSLIHFFSGLPCFSCKNGMVSIPPGIGVINDKAVTLLFFKKVISYY